MPARHFSIVLFCLCFSLFASSQDTTFQRILSAKDDSLKVKQMIDYGRNLLDVDNAAAEPIFKKSIEIAERIHYYKGAGQGWMGMGYINSQKGAYYRAIEDYRTAAVYLANANMANRAAECMNVVGTIYDFVGKRDSAIIIYMQSIRLLENTVYKSSLGATYSYVGVLHHNANDYEKAVFYKTKAVDILRQTTDTVNLIEALTELAETRAATKETQKGMPLAYDALKLAHILNRDNKSRSILATAFYTLSILHLGFQQVDSATLEAKLCIEHAEASGDINTYISGAILLSDCYNQSGKQTERYNALRKALEQGKKAGNFVLLQSTYDKLADAAGQLNKYQDAYEYHKQFVHYKDSLFNQKNQNILSELEVKYQTSQKEKEISQKQLQLQKSRQVIYGTLGVLAIALLLTGMLYSSYRNKKKTHKRELQSFRQEKEIQLLQAIMQGEEKERTRIAKDLHDGVAGMLAAVKMHLSSIPSLSEELLHTEEYRQGMRLLNEATQEIRKTSHNLMPEVLLQHGLDEALRRYCNSVNNSKTLQVQYDSWGEVDRFVDGFELSVYRIVQELLNNIIKHSKASQALVQLTQQEELLTISIEDNGIGFSAERGVTEGMGLRSLQSRVKAMNGKMEMQATPQSGVSAYLEFEISELKQESTAQYER